jgi:C4-dicarboxylate transporter, DctM subunit
LGCFFDGLSLMIMTLPIVVPLMVGLGYDPIWLGVVITILIEIGQVTPPVGLNLSVLVSVTKEKVSLGEVASATIPYWLILLAGILILTILPQIALFLPSALM